jgi:photosystem II stability/assembly factor-like uncharacterized protein
MRNSTVREVSEMDRSVVMVICLLCSLVFSPALSAERIPEQRGRVVDRDTAVEIMPGVVVVKIREQSRPPFGALQKTPGTLAVNLLKAGVNEVHPIVPADARLAKLGAPADPVGISRIYLGTLSAAADPWTVAAALSALPEVEYAEPKYLQRINDVPNDALIANQVNILTRLNAFNGWTIAKGSPTVIIADVDGGTYWRHEDLIGNVRVNPSEDINHNGVFDAGDINGVDDDGNGYVDDVVGWNFARNTNDPTGSTSTPQSAAHGTATASHFCAVTNNSKGIAGTSWNCALLPICVASSTADNSIDYGYEGIIYAYRNGAKVINCSWGAQGNASRFHQDVIDAATAAGALVVAAAGNDGSDNDASPYYPASYRNVLPIGGLNSGDNAKAWFSNYGVSVPVYTPAVSILSAFTGGGYGDGGSGTSYASSLASGLAGILRAAYPAWSPVQIAAQLRATADAVDADNAAYSGHMGRGRLNLARALSESHAAISVLSSQLRTTKGDSVFLPGDTILFTAKVQNVLGSTATSVQFNLSASNATLRVIDGAASLSSLAPGQSADLRVLRLLVGPLTSATRLYVRLDWTFNGSERDAAVTRTLLLPAKPSWYLSSYSARTELFSIRAVSKEIVWAAGGDRSESTPVVVRSIDGGKTWSDVTANLPLADFYCIAALDTARAWVGSGDGRIFATSDGGKTWAQQLYAGVQSPFINGIRVFPGGKGFAMGDPPGTGRFVVLKTSDYGVTWTHLAAEPTGTSDEAGWNNSFWWVDADHGWFGSNKNHVWRTTDGGTSWSFGSTGGAKSYGVAFSDISYGFAIHDSGVVARTTNGGVSWSPVTFPTTSQCTGVGVAPGTSWAWVSNSLDVYYTRNGGTSWSTESLYPFDGAISSISLVDTTSGWAATSNGELLKFIPPWVKVIPEPIIPEATALYQNYPNPFNPSTQIRYSVPTACDVTLTVYDLLGRRVSTLVDEWREPGEYEVQFTGAGLASGVYLYRLNAGKHTVVKKMMVVR